MGSKIVNGSALQVAVCADCAGQYDCAWDSSRRQAGDDQGDGGRIPRRKRKLRITPDSGSAKGGRLGLAVANLTPDVRQQMNIPEQVKGAAIESVRPGSPADDAGLAPGDVIQEVNRHSVTNADSFVNDVHSVPAGKDILLLVWANGGASYRVVHPAENLQSGM